MNSIKPIHFSDYFNIDRTTLRELGVFDPILNIDTKVFVEPLLLKNSTNEIIRGSYQTYKKFFANLLLLLQTSNQVDDRSWRAAKNMVNFPEYQYTCIGYSSGTTDGRGSGIEFNDKILQSAKEIVDLAEGNPEIFLLLPLLEEGIAGDRISDMAQNIIDDEICRYTEDVMAKIGLKGNYRHMTKNNKSYHLLLNPYSKRPIKLVPLDILLKLPIADDVDNVVEALATRNERLRDIVNRDIGDIWFQTTKARRKEALLKELKTNKEFFIETLKVFKKYNIKHYDLEKDPDGVYRWLENSQEFVDFELTKEAKNCPDDLDSLMFAVTSIIQHFKDTIENKKMWRTFWTRHDTEYCHVKGYYSHMLFYTVCRAWLVSQDSNIIINFKQQDKRLILEFTISGKDRLILHITHANSTSLVKGYKGILEKYRQVSNEKHCCLIMNFKVAVSKQLQEIRIIQNPICEIFEIDVTIKDLEQDGYSINLPNDELGFLMFEDIEFEDSHYTREKRKGGESSYQQYKPMRDKVAVLCKEELTQKNYTSARKLCNTVASRIKTEYPNLLATYPPYKNSCQSEGNDWKEPRLYQWCNLHFKAFRNKSCSIVD